MSRELNTFRRIELIEKLARKFAEMSSYSIEPHINIFESKYKIA